MATTWLRSQYYGRGASVLYNGYSFTSLQNSNIANIPPTSPTWWQGAQGIQGLTQGPGISVNTSDPAAPVISTNVQFNQGTGITVSGPTGAHPQQWTIAQTSTGVTSLANGEALPETGPLKLVGGTNTTIDSTTTPGSFIFNTPAVASLANGAGTAQTGPLKLVAGSNMAIDSTTTAGSFILNATGAAGGVTSVTTTSPGLSGGGTGAVTLTNTGVTSANATPGIGLFLSGASTGDIVLNNHTSSLFYTTPGSYTFTAAAPCTVVFTLAGGGGGGGSAVYYFLDAVTWNAKGGGGGSSGQIVSGSVTLLTGDTMSMVVGGAGAGDSSNADGNKGGDGGDTTLQVGTTGELIWTARGGTGGFSPLNTSTAGTGADPYSTNVGLAYGTLVGFGGGGGGMADYGSSGYAGNPGYNVPSTASTPPGSGSYVSGGFGAVASGGVGGTNTPGGIPTQIAGGAYWIAGGGGGGGPFASKGSAYQSPAGATPTLIPNTPASRGCGGGGGACFVNATGTDAQAYPGLTGGKGYISLLISYSNV